MYPLLKYMCRCACVRGEQARRYGETACVCVRCACACVRRAPCVRADVWWTWSWFLMFCEHEPRLTSTACPTHSTIVPVAAMAAMAAVDAVAAVASVASMDALAAVAAVDAVDAVDALAAVASVASMAGVDAVPYAVSLIIADLAPAIAIVAWQSRPETKIMHTHTRAQSGHERSHTLSCTHARTLHARTHARIRTPAQRQAG